MSISSCQLDEPVISVKDVTKVFKIFDDPIIGPIKASIPFINKQKIYKEFTAIDGVNLDVYRGEVIGLLGLNGSGKTTLLKMIAGLLPVSDGEITVRGKVTALLALGVGVHPEFSGRENIYYSGLLYGMKSEEIKEKTGDIIRFADIGEFIDLPLRTYSSGMRARLLFSIAMSIDPDILIVDEALATGDASFIVKSQSRIQELCQSGATILFVSHSSEQVRKLCDKALVLHKGRSVSYGNVDQQIEFYHQIVHEQEAKKSVENELSSRYLNLSGDNSVVVDSIRIIDSEGDECCSLFTGDKLQLDVHYRSIYDSPIEVDAFLGFDLKNEGRYVAEIQTHHLLNAAKSGEITEFVEISQEGILSFLIESMPLLNNHYSLWFIMQNKNGEVLCEVRGVSPFFISQRGYSDYQGGAISAIPAKVQHKSIR